MNVFKSFGATLVNLLNAVDTTVNMANRLVNTGDNYLQTVERHAVDYNYESQVVSAERREQLEITYAQLTPAQKKALIKAKNKDVSIFDQIMEEEEKVTKNAA